MENKYRPIPRWKLLNGVVQRDAVNRSKQPAVIIAVLPFYRFLLRVVRFIERYLLYPLLPQMHQNYVHYEAMEPSGKSRLSAKRGDLPEELQKRFLSQILRF